MYVCEYCFDLLVFYFNDLVVVVILVLAIVYIDFVIVFYGVLLWDWY